MNERIKELARQAELAELYDRYVEYCMKNADDDIMDYDTIVKKFAELIVKECIDVFSKDLPDSTSPDYQLGSLPEVVNRVCNVAEHFGVEE